MKNIIHEIITHNYYTLRYDEESMYDYGRPGFSMATAHFTQVVWIGTSHFGIAKATAANGNVILIFRSFILRRH